MQPSTFLVHSNLENRTLRLPSCGDDLSLGLQCVFNSILEAEHTMSSSAALVILCMYVVLTVQSTENI